MSPLVETLSSGLTVVADPMADAGTVSVAVAFRAGSRSEEEAEHGLAHLLEHMAFKGTERRSARLIAEEIEAVGGDLNAATSIETTTYYARVMPEDIGLALDILADILVASTFDEEELTREKNVICQEIGAVEDTPDDLVFDLAQEVSFPGQAVGRPILGTPDSVNAMSRDALHSFLKRCYGAPNAVVSIAGAISGDTLVKDVEAAFAGLNRPALATPDPARWAGGEVRREDDLEQAHVVLSLPGVSHHDADSFAMQVFSSLVGGGMSSRLFQEVRETRGLAYSIYSHAWSMGDGGVFSIYAGTAPEDLDELMRVITGELAAAAETATEAEIARARAQLRMSVRLSGETAAGRADQHARQMLTFGRLRPASELLEHIEAVDGAAVKRAAARLFAGAPTLAAVGPLKRLMPLEDIAARLGAPRPQAA